jgi:PAS domain S-box-containing protein
MWRLLIVFILLAVLPLILAAFVFLHNTADTFKRFACSVGDEMDELHVVASNLQESFRRKISALAALAQEAPRCSNARGRSQILERALRRNPEFSFIAFIDARGVLACYGGRKAGSLPRAEPHMAALKEGRRVRSEVFFSSEKEPLIDIFIPLAGERGFEGALVGRLSLRALFLKFKKVLRSGEGNAYILDGNGRILCLASQALQTYHPLSPGQKIDLARYGGVDLVERDNIRFIRSYVPFREIGGQILWERPFSHFGHMAARLYYNTFLWIALALLAAILTGMWKVRKIAVPIENLTRASQAFMKGNLDEEIVRTRSYSELTLLMDSFETMRRDLGRIINENLDLVRRTQEHLKERVGELKALHSVSEAFSSTGSLQDLFSLIVEKAMTLYSAAFCNLYLLEAQGLFVLQCSRGLSSDDLARLFANPWRHEDPFLRTVISAKKVLDVGEPYYIDSVTTRLPMGGRQGYCIVPLICRGQLLGMIEMGLRDALPKTDEVRELLATLGREAGIAIANARLYHQVVEEKIKSQALVQSMSEGVLTVDSSLRITSFNRAAAALTGWKEEEAVGKFCFVVFQGRSTDGEIVCMPETCSLARAASIGEQPKPYELTVQSKDGVARVLQFVPTVMRGSGVENPETVVIVRDISKIRELEQLKSEFISTISHELKTPITSIKGCVATLLHPRASFDNETTMNFLRIISGETERLNGLVQDLLEAARLESDRLVLEIESFRVEKLADKVLSGFKGSEPHTFVADLAGTTMAWGDPYQFEFVLKHLLTNAVKYSPSGGVIEMGITTRDEMVHITVKDQGIGIPAGESERIFEMFSRLHSGNTRWAYGTGMGLFLARKIVEAQGGKISVESVLGKGSTFIFSLPAAKTAPVA